MRSKLLSLCVASGLLASQGFAQTLNVVQVEGAYGVESLSEMKQVYACASKYFRKVGVNFRVKYFKLINNPCYVFHDVRTRSAELNCLSIYKVQRRKNITYFMTAPFIDGSGTGWIAGIAKLCGNVSTGNASSRAVSQGVLGASRIQHSATVLAHEVMHNMCATHYPSDTNTSVANIMNPAANSLTNQYGCNIPVLNVTKRQVKRWYARNR